MILVLAANTAFSDFPRLSFFLARDGFIPRQYANRGDRLAFSNGILTLGLFSSALIVIFQGDVNRIIPLYAIGVFTSFTLSQTGMVVRWWRRREPGWVRSIALNGLGAFATALVLVVVAVTKFATGAWAILVLIPALVWLFTRIKVHYSDVASQLSLDHSQYVPRRLKQKVVIPVGGIHRGILQALDYARSISDDATAVYVDIDTQSTEAFIERWGKWTDVPLVVVPSPTRSILEPLLDYFNAVESTCQDSVMTVIVPTFVTAKWWQNLLHNQTAFLIKSALLLQRRKVVVSVRFYLDR